MTLIKNIGCPHIFLTLSPNDLGDFEMYHAADPIRFPTPESVETTGRRAKGKFVNKHCPLFVRMMYERFYEVLTKLQTNESPLGKKVVDYFWRVEEQGKTTLHFHCVLYFDPKDISTDVNDPNRVPALLKFVKNNVSCHLPTDDEDKDVDSIFFGLQKYVKEFQRHHHPNKCQDVFNASASKNKEKNKDVRTRRSLHKRALDRERTTGPDLSMPASSSINSFETDKERRKFFAEQGERRSCRFGYPHPNSATTHLRTSEECQYLVRGDRDIIMQRIGKEERWINPYVPKILRIWKGNMDVQAVIEPHATMAYLLSYVTKHHRDETKWLDECTRELQTQGNTNVRSMLFKYGNSYLSNRKIGKQLTCAICMQFPLYGFSCQSIHLNLGFPSKRRYICKSNKELEKLADESMEVSLPDIITHYQSRPTGQNEDDDLTVDLTGPGRGEDQGVVVQDKDVAPTSPSLPLTSPSPREVPFSATTSSSSASLSSVLVLVLLLTCNDPTMPNDPNLY